MKQKGFTLVELLGVLAILAIIFVIVVPSVNSVLSKSKETIYQQQINKILTAAYDFSLKNIDYLPDYNNKSYLTLGQLKSEGLIDINIKNPNTNEIFSDNLVISINNVGSTYKYSNKNSKLKGVYLYTLEIENLNKYDSTLIPKITLKVNEEELKPNSNGNYIKSLNLNESFTDVSYSAISHDGKDLTNKVSKIITFNNKSVDSVNSSNAGIYKIYYSVVDEDGYSNALIFNIIIADKIPPKIIFPEKTILNKDITNYDLLEGVKCEDNSGFCDLTYSTELDYSIVGSQIIEYTAKDPSGNTVISKRVIEIE